MIVTDRFVFVHMHKTGGQTINKIIGNCIDDHRVVGYHYPVAELPDDARALPVVGIVRNPWDWYASWYAFNRRPGIRNQLFHVVSGGGVADFKTTVSNLVQLGSDTPESAAHRAQLSQLLPDALEGNRGAGLTRSCMQELADANCGYLSWLFFRMLGDPDSERLEIGRFENLQDDFLEIMSRLGVTQVDAMRTAFNNQARANVSRHSHYSHYYDDELRDLVATRDDALIEKYGYEFESLKPMGAHYEFPDDAYADGERGFHKLLGRADNFLRLNEEIDTTAIREKVEQISAERWAESDRRKIFNVHRNTQSLSLVHFEDYKYDEPEYRDLYSELEDEIVPVVDYIANYYRNNGFIVRAMLARLEAGGEIPRHTDAGYSLMNCHRVHLPIITSEKVDFFVGGETVQMREGELWEINNATEHAVSNNGTEDRVHLIVDWMPNLLNQPANEVLTADQLDEEVGEAANEEMLGSIIAQANQLHRSGDLRKAEALYRQVLHFDEDHVIANNLLGLLCIQSRRFGEALTHIERALKIAPDDAQAHANLGVALKEVGRPEDAARHLEESLRLAPNVPRVLNNLGSIYFLLGRAAAAIKCFQDSLVVQPGSLEAHFNLGSALLQLQRYEEAVAHLEQCVRLRPDFEEGRNRFEKARQLLQASRTR
jgi:Flp pilus assembly protein TadD/quercetin dioxygenase-like cupin family protein